jgi:hypothetical protein
MILSDEIKIRLNYNNINHFKNLGYDINNKFIDVKVEHLNKGSHAVISIKCDVCGTEKNLQYNAYLKYLSRSDDNKYRCGKCNQINRKNTNIEKYGEDSPIKIKDFVEKRKKTILKKYGHDHPCKSVEIKEKIKNTNLKKYGVEHPSQLKEFRDKINTTNLERYGNINSLMNKKILEKTFNTMVEKYSVKYSMQNEQIKDKIIKNGEKTRMKKILNNDKDIVEINYEKSCYVVKCDQNKEHNYTIDPHLYCQRKKYKMPLCTICNPVEKHKSGTELLILNFIKENYKNEILLNNRNLIKPYELDIYIPDLKLGVEYNGLYWHSELYKDRSYHLNKIETCEKNKIQLIQIWEDDWIYKQDIIKSIILNKLKKTTNKIFARNCEIKEIKNNKLIKKFLNENHIQGFIGSKIKIGLYYKNELISLMTFGSRRVAMGKKSTNDGEYELLRFCNKLNTNIVGGANKLFKYFLNNYNPKEVISYADRSWSQGNLYRVLGFDYVNKTKPNYYYVLNFKRLHRFNFRKDKLVKEGYDPNKTEEQIMSERKIFRIYDSGSLKFVFKN